MFSLTNFKLKEIKLTNSRQQVKALFSRSYFIQLLNVGTLELSQHPPCCLRGSPKRTTQTHKNTLAEKLQRVISLTLWRKRRTAHHADNSALPTSVSEQHNSMTHLAGSVLLLQPHFCWALFFWPPSVLRCSSKRTFIHICSVRLIH